jgi:hypothetical protein
LRQHLEIVNPVPTGHLQVENNHSRVEILLDSAKVVVVVGDPDRQAEAAGDVFQQLCYVFLTIDYQ